MYVSEYTVYTSNKIGYVEMLQIVMKHLQWSLFVRFLRGVAYLFSAHFWTAAASHDKL